MLLYEDILECMDRPMVESGEEEIAPQPKVMPSAGQKSSRILIAESDPSSLEALREMCAVLGYKADEVASVADAMTYLERSRPRCLLLAMMLPDGSGVNILRQVRERFLPIKVAILFSSADPRGFLDEVNHLRADGLFLRPLNIPSIASWLWLANN
ncbi:MAG TPA: response regulator [Tepidisphaeraceae bacterium]|jgi:CheY-like chemotaxis protein|nr:response regulator [Tepidisphaeraceae bacterium]